MPAYDYTCALTRYRLVTIDAGALVDAAHIHQFAESLNNVPGNGLALSKNTHWMFDKGLWSMNDDCCVVVKQDRFAEAGPTEMRLNNFNPVPAGLRRPSLFFQDDLDGFRPF